MLLLKPWEGAGASELPYRVDTLAGHGVAVDYSDAVHHRPWTYPPVRRVVRRLERLGAPFLQTLLATGRIARSDAVVAQFESQANALAVLRALRLWPYTRPRLVVVACWLAMDAPTFAPWRRRLYRWAYRGVDRLVYFSPNQTEVYREVLGVPPEKLRFLPFGIDHERYRPSEDGGDDGYVLAVGRDRGRDWPTFFDAVRGSGLDVRVACRPEDIVGLDVPPEVTVVGYVDRARYRALLDRARVVVVATHVRAYPTGQSVTLEAMAMGRCCVVTDTPAMGPYVRHGVDALTVPPADSGALRAAIDKAVADGELRRRLGAAARAAVEQRFTAAAMWGTIRELAVGPA